MLVAQIEVFGLWTLVLDQQPWGAYEGIAQAYEMPLLLYDTTTAAGTQRLLMDLTLGALSVFFILVVGR